MPNLEEMQYEEERRKLREAEARRRWEFEDLQRTKRDVIEKDFPDEWLEEIESEATK